MARHFRMQSQELYDKLGMKKKKYRVQTSSDASRQDTTIDPSTFNNSFYMTEPKTFRTKSAEAVKRSENSPVDFKKQLPRAEFFTAVPQAHEKRFVPYNDNPPMSSRHRPVNTPKFNLYLSRKDQVVNISLRSKELNYSAIERDPNQGLVPFAKVSGRKYPPPDPSHIDKLVKIDYDPLDVKVSIPDIGKISSRKVESDLPLFMVNVIDHGRNMSLKSLKMNNYMNTEFLPLGTGFGEGKLEKVHFPIPIKGRCPKIVKVLKEKLKMT